MLCTYYLSCSYNHGSIDFSWVDFKIWLEVYDKRGVVLKGGQCTKTYCTKGFMKEGICVMSVVLLTVLYKMGGGSRE